MKCNTNNIEELNNVVKNGGVIYETSVNQTQQTTLSFFNHTSDNFEKKDLVYQTVDGGSKLSKTVTTEISKKLEKKYGMSKFENLEIMAEIGTFTHAINEGVFKFLIDRTKGQNASEILLDIDLERLKWSDLKNDAIEYLKPIYNKHNIKLTSSNKQGMSNLESLYNGVLDLYKDIITHQHRLNTKGIPGDAVLLLEQIVVDPKSDIGGTADLIVLFSDNTAALYDFKSKIPAKKYLDEKGNLVTYDYITKSAKEKYKMQLHNLQRILVTKYGVKQVTRARIVPIQLEVPLDPDGKLGKTVTNIVYGDKQNRFLAQYAPLPEVTGLKHLDEYLKDIETKIRNYTNKNDKGQYTNRIEELEIVKQSILTRLSYDSILSYASDLITEYDDLSKLSIERLRELKDELNSLLMLNRVMHDLKQNLEEESKQALESSLRIISTGIVDKLFEVENELYNKRLNNYVNNLTGYSLVDQSGEFITFNDEGFLSKYINQLSQFDNPLFKTLKATIDDAKYNVREKVKSLIENVITIDSNLRNWMAQNGKDEKWLIDSLIDTDSSSKDADNLYSKLSDPFRKELAKIKEGKDIDKIIRYYEPSEYHKQNFERLKAEKKAHYEKTLPDAKSVKYAFEKWLNNNDLTFTNGEPTRPSAWFKQLKFGKLKLKESIIEKNYSDKFKYIQSVPPLLAYYEMFENYNKEFRDVLGLEYYNLPNNFLPNVRKSNIDRMLDNGVIQGTKDIIDNFIQELDVREDDMIYGEIDPDTGEMKKTIPRFYINPFRNKNGEVAIGEKSYDLTKSLIIFSKMAYNYQYMNDVEAVVLTMRDFLSEKGEQVIRRGDHVLKDFVGNELSSKIQGTSTEKIFQSFVDLYLYGVNVNPISADSSGKYEKLILEAKQYFTLKALGLGFIPSLGSFLAAKTQAAIEGFKGQIYTSDQYKTSMKYIYSDREKFHALYAFFDPMNIKYDFFNISDDKIGIGDPRERNKIKKYVNSRVLLRSFSAGDEFIDEVILASMAQNFYIDTDGNLRRMKNDEERATKKSLWESFSYKDGEANLDINPEKLKKVIIDFRNAAQAAQSKIKGVIPEDDKAYWQTQIVGQVLMHFKSWMPGVMKERFGSVRYNDALQMVEMGRFTAFKQEMHSVEQLSIIPFIREIAIPKLLELFKHIMFFGGKGSNERLRMAYEAWLFRNPQHKGIVSFEDFMTAQRAQMKALIIELRLILAMAMLIALLTADFDDDGEKFYQEMWLTRKLVAVLAKTNQELSFTYNPAEFASMIKNPIPMAGVLTDAVNVLSNTYDETIDTVLGEKVPLPFHKAQTDDKTGFGYYTGKLIPGVSQLEKFLEIFNKDNSLK